MDGLTYRYPVRYPLRSRLLNINESRVLLVT